MPVMAVTGRHKGGKPMAGCIMSFKDRPDFQAGCGTGGRRIAARGA
jgi:hypothetical protein